MVFADGGPAMDYSSDSIYGCADTHGDSQQHAPRFNEVVERVTRNGIAKDASIVDVGCATGGLLHAYKAAGYPRVKGVSLSAAEVGFCQAHGLEAELRSVENPDRRHDVVMLSHVLEHVTDVQSFLGNLRRWVKPGTGILYIEVPDATHYDSHLTSVSQGFNSEHINHFSLKLMQAACAATSMEVVESGSAEAYFHSPNPSAIVWSTFRVPAPRDPELRESIGRYIEVLSRQMEGIISRLDLKDIPMLSLWGLGQSTDLLIGAGTIDTARVAYATDTNPSYHGKSVGKATVVSPEEFAPPADVPILVCAQQSKDAIVARIRELGLPNRVITLED